MNPLKANSITLNSSVLTVTSGILSVGGTNVVHANQTGSFTTSSQTGSFITTSQTGAFADSSKTGIFISTGQTGQFYPNGQNPSGYAMSTQTGVYADSATNLGTGSGFFGSKVNGQLQFKSMLPGSGITFTGDANTLSINTYLGYQLKTGAQLDVVMTTGSLYYNIISGTVGPGTWLAIAQSTFRVIGNSPTGVRIVTQLWNGNTGAGIFSAAETIIATSGQAASGYAPMDLTAIVTLTGATNTLGLRAASTLPNTYALSSNTEFATGVLSGVSTYIHAVRLL